jgi:hypothetical protein
MEQLPTHISDKNRVINTFKDINLQVGAPLQTAKVLAWDFVSSYRPH